jgi:hypothetical protein
MSDKDDRWIARNFDRIVDLYGGRSVAVVNRRIVAVGDRLEDVEKRARHATGAKSPAVLRVPQKDKVRIALSPVRLFDLS